MSQPITPGVLLNPGLSGLGRILASAQFAASLTTGIVPERAVGSAIPTYTNASASLTRSIADWEGILRYVLSGESRHGGARRVRNLILGSSEDLTNGNWAPVVTGSGTVTFSADKKTATCTVGVGDRAFIQQTQMLASGSYRASATQSVVSGTPTSGSIFGTDTVTASGRICGAVTGASGSTNIRFGIGVNGAASLACVVTITLPQFEDVTGQSNQNPSESTHCWPQLVLRPYL